MKKPVRWVAVTSVLALSTLLVGSSLAATGDENDPLITLSYLDQVVIPQVIAQVEEGAARRQTELEKSFTDQVAQYKKEMEASIGGQGTKSAAFELVTLVKGQTMALEVGCEVMLRVGSVQVNSKTNPALIDIATGGDVKNGTSLTKNHLYMTTIPDRTLTPTTETVKLLVRGGYSMV